MSKNYPETELYEPVKKFLTGLGYHVQGEVRGCDLTAVREDELVIVELKKSFSIELLYQAMDRQAITDQVYAAVPRPLKNESLAIKNMTRIIKKLDLGLITVAMDSPLKYVEAVVHPGESKRRKSPKRRQSLLSEMAGRNYGDNTGGSHKVKLLTAYKEKSIRAACVLEKQGSVTTKELVNDFGFDKGIQNLLYRNYNGWFERVDKGTYALSEEGRKAISEGKFGEVADYYRGLLL